MLRFSCVANEGYLITGLAIFYSTSSCGELKTVFPFFLKKNTYNINPYVQLCTII